MYTVFIAASCVAALLSSALALSQGAENYPSRPVTIVAPYSPGAGAEIEGRLYANELSKNLGQQFIMDFKPGAAQILGMNYAARQKPDGYTLVWTTSTYSLLPLMTKERGFDPYRDFDPVALMSKRSALLVVSNNLPVKNITEYIAYAKANPGAVNFATGGLGGIQHLTGLWLTSATNTQVTFVHYKSISASYPDIMAGRANMAPGTLAGWLPMVKAGKLRAIATASLQRNPALPDLSTATEQGVPGFEYSSWLGMIAPAKTPVPIINKVHAELVKITKNPEIKEKLGDETTVLALGPAEFRKAAMAETERFRKLLADNNIKLEE
ncbi:MAG: tripartite tricarboxylate transporter substrate binding protein [Betaproteobacteria bacterium]|nr:tripartite tricarboxylate transporter substrate binding protein [Betaproteobacteria bacterium]